MRITIITSTPLILIIDTSNLVCTSTSAVGLVNDMLGRFLKFCVALVIAVLFASTASFAGVVVKDNEIKRSIPKGKEIVLDKIKEQNPAVLLGRFTEKTVNADGEDVHPFIGMVAKAYAEHYPIEIYPDDIWLLLLDGIKIHVNSNREKFRDEFVVSGADSALAIEDNSLTLSSPPEKWEQDVLEVYDSLFQKIPKKTRASFDVNFSTTTPVSAFTFKAMLMSIASNYFTFGIMTACGIPEFAVKGTMRDWILLKARFNELANILEMDWWAGELNPILDKIIEAFGGKKDLTFWRGFYKYIEGEGCGWGPKINGWITKFFPYRAIEDDKRVYVRKTDWNAEQEFEDFPTGRDKVPILWNNLGKKVELELVVGFWGHHVDKKRGRLRSVRGYTLSIPEK